jgi:hypothetical protein
MSAKFRAGGGVVEVRCEGKSAWVTPGPRGGSNKPENL